MVHVCYRINAFLEGFYDIIPKRLISIFNEQELELLISGLPNVDIEDLRANTEYHKYQPTSLQVRVIIWAASISEKLKKLGIAGCRYCFRAGPVVNPFSATGRYISFCSSGEKCREPMYQLLLLGRKVPRADISASAPQAKSAASRYIGSSVDHN
jgi:hypothetical protein